MVNGNIYLLLSESTNHHRKKRNTPKSNRPFSLDSLLSITDQKLYSLEIFFLSMIQFDLSIKLYSRPISILLCIDPFPLYTQRNIFTFRLNCKNFTAFIVLRPFQGPTGGGYTIPSQVPPKKLYNHQVGERTGNESTRLQEIATHTWKETSWRKDRVKR